MKRYEVVLALAAVGAALLLSAAPAHALKTNVEVDGDSAVIKLQGALRTPADDEVALVTATKDVMKTGVAHIVFDMSGRDIDGAGIGALVSAYSMVARSGGQVRLAGLPASISSLVELTALAAMFQIYDSTADAIRSM